MNIFDKAYVNRRFDAGGYEVHLSSESGGVRNIVTGMSAVTVPLMPGMYQSPAMMLSDQEAQVLLQALWDAGLRPSSGEGVSAHVDALKAHLNDMRAIAMAHAMPDAVTADMPRMMPIKLQRVDSDIPNF